MKKILSAGMLLLLLLAACGNGDQTPSVPPSDGTPQAASGTDAAEASAVWQTVSFSDVAPAPDGCYIFQPRVGDGANILYADYATGQLVYLCNRPECTHDNESCLSYRGKNTGSIAYFDDQLYLLDMNGLEDYIPHLSVCDRNGENEKNLMALESGNIMLDSFATDGDAFYTIQELYSDNEQTRYLVRIGLPDGTKTRVSEKEYPFGSMLCGVGSEVVLRLADISESGEWLPSYELVGVNTNTGEERFIYTGSTGILAGAKDGFAYALRMEEGAIDAVDLATGEVQTTSFDKNAITLYEFVPDVSGLPAEDAAYQLAHPPEMYNSLGIFDGKLFLMCQEDFDGRNYQRVQYAIDLASGDVQRITLAISFEAKMGNPIFILGEVGDDFFVLRDYINEPYPSVTKDGTPYEAPHVTSQYALIAKEDFYASNPNYRDFVLS